MSTRFGISPKFTVSNDDILTSLNEFKSKIINSNKTNSDLHAKQFKGLLRGRLEVTVNERINALS